MEPGTTQTALIVRAAVYHPLRQQIIEGDRSAKDRNSRITIFCDWADEQRMRWFEPDLAAWRDHLLEQGMAAASVQAYISTVRGAYLAALRDNRTRTMLFDLTPDQLGPSDRKAIVDEMLVRLQNAIHPTTSAVSVTRQQDVEDSAHLRLSASEAEALLNSPDIADLRGLRDSAVIALLLCTGLREAELCSLNVDDLYQRLGGEPALRVRHGKGNKARLIPYGDLEWCLSFVQAWLRRARIGEGAVFRGLYKGRQDGQHKLRPGRLDVRSVQRILAAYPLPGGTRVRPHDCRRTYARRLFEAGMELIAIQQNLGHSDVKTTLHYIGQLDADKRRGRGVYNPGLDKLSRLQDMS